MRSRPKGGESGQNVSSLRIRPAAERRKERTPVRALRYALEPRLLVAIAGAGAVLALFMALAGLVSGGGTDGLDRALLMALRTPGDPAMPRGPAWFRESVRDLSALGSPAILGLLVAATAAFLLLARRPRTAGFVVAAAGGGALVSLLLKAGFARPRPDLAPYGSQVFTASFPSGHAMLSAVVYLTLGALLARLVPGYWQKRYLMAVAVTLTTLIGASRVYLGVHWPSDVLAGWALGAAWALGCWILAQLMAQGTEGRT